MTGQKTMTEPTGPHGTAHFPAGPDRSAARTTRVLVVEDEPNIRELVCLHLRLEGYSCDGIGNGQEALEKTEAEAYDLVVLDLMIPGLDGIAVCRAVRRGGMNRDVPILMLTAKREEADKVLGLESGADDYLAKPFGVRELVARARALLRRPRASQSAAAPPPEVVEAGGLRIDRARRQALLDGRLLDLTPHEFDVLYLLAANPGIV